MKRATWWDQVHQENSGPNNEDICIDEDGVPPQEIDPTEPRYYLFGDASLGTIDAVRIVI